MSFQNRESFLSRRRRTHHQRTVTKTFTNRQKVNTLYWEIMHYNRKTFSALTVFKSTLTTSYLCNELRFFLLSFVFVIKCSILIVFLWFCTIQPPASLSVHHIHMAAIFLRYHIQGGQLKFFAPACKSYK